MNRDFVSRRHMLLTLTYSSALTSAGYQTQTSGRAIAQSKFIDVNGVKLHYLEWGSGQARPMLLLHPAPLNAHVWGAFGAAMSRHFHVVAPDARGFGDSQWSTTYDGDVFVQDLQSR